MLYKNILEYYYDYVIDLEEFKEMKINVEIYFIFEKEFFMLFLGKE